MNNDKERYRAGDKCAFDANAACTKYCIEQLVIVVYAAEDSRGIPLSKQTKRLKLI